MAFEYGISAKLNVDGALKNVEKLLSALEQVENKAKGLKVGVTVNNELVAQVSAIKEILAAKKDDLSLTVSQAKKEAELAEIKRDTARAEKENALGIKATEEWLAQQKAKTAKMEQENAQKAAAAEQKLAESKKKADDEALARAAKLKQEEQKAATEAERTAQIRQKTEDAAAKAAQDRANTQRKADQTAEDWANKINEGRLRGEERVRQEHERTAQSQINTYTAILRLIDQKSRTEYNAEQREQKAAEARWRREQKIQKEEKENADAIARDAEKQARIEQAQLEIEEQKNAKTRELRAAIQANQQAQDNYNRTLAKALPTVNEIRQAMERLTASQEALQTAQARANSPLSFLIGRVGPEGSWGRNLRSLGGGISKVGELIQGFSQAYNVIQEGATTITSKIWGVANSFFNRVTSGFTSLTEEGLEAFGTLEMAEIGFANFFDGSATEFTRKIKEAAVDMPMVGAADLARSVQYIAPLAKGDSDLALAAVEGVMKSIVYSGNDVSQYGTKALQNLTQVASGNLTATDIKEMMRQMPALPRLLASTETGSELLEGGQITTKAVKNYIAKYGSDAILGVFKEISEKSEASDIYDIANTTFKGALEQIQEKAVLAWQNAFDNSGAANLFKDLLNELSQKGGIIDQFSDTITHYARTVVNWFKLNQNEIKELMDQVGAGLGQIVGIVKDIAKEVLNSLDIMNGDKINTKKFKEVIDQIVGFVKGIVKGFGEGFKTLFNFLDMLREKFGPEVFEKLGYGIGMLASPLGKLGSALGTFSSNSFRALGGVIDTVGRLLQTKTADGAITWTGKIANALNISKADSKIPQAIGNAAYTVSGGRLSSAGTASTVASIGQFLGKAVKGAGFAALGLTVTSVTKEFASLLGASKEVVSGISGLGTGISLAAAGFTMFGPGGAIIGGILGAVTGFVTEMNRQKELLYQENAKKSNEEIQKYLTEEGGEKIKSMTDDVFAMLAEQGVEIDRGSDSGKYAELMLQKKINELLYTRDENGNITAVHADRVLTALGNGELAKVAAGWYRDQEVKEAVARLTEKEEFLTAGGNVIDFEKDTSKRDALADFIKRNWLNGDTTEYNYDTNSAETIVRDYLQTISPNGKQELTTEQYQMLFALEDETAKQLDPLLETASAVTGLKEDMSQNWNDVISVKQNTNKWGWSIYQTLREINNKVGETNRANGTYGQDSTNYWGADSFINTNTSNAIVSWREKGEGGAFGGGSYDNKYTLPNGQREYRGIALHTRNKMAELYGKKPGDNDDFGETLEKMNQAANKIVEKMTDASGNELQTLINDYEELERWRDKLQMETVIGDWGALFKAQNEMAKLVGRYGVQFRASGGIIEALFGRGRGVDTVPAFLQPGEFVMRKSAVDKAGPSVFAALNRGDFAGAAQALGNKFNNSWDNSHHWSNQITTNNNNTANNYFFAGGQVRGRRAPYRAMANRVATI